MPSVIVGYSKTPSCSRCYLLLLLAQQTSSSSRRRSTGTARRLDQHCHEPAQNKQTVIDFSRTIAALISMHLPNVDSVSPMITYDTGTKSGAARLRSHMHETSDVMS